MNFKIPTEPYWPNSVTDDLYRSSNFTPLVSNSVIEMDYPADNDTMLNLIASLIKKIQSLKSENAILRTHLKADPSRSKLSKDTASFNSSKKQPFMCKYFQQGFCRNGQSCKFRHKARKLQSSFERKGSENGINFDEMFRRPCIYCREKHVHGSSNCRAFGAVCTFCQGRNHLDIACFYNNPHL